MKMIKPVILLMLLTVSNLYVSAKTYKLEGTVGDKYPIVIELEEHDDGLFSGRYAYKSTLLENGDGECSWLQINPSYGNPTSEWTVRDCTPDVVETWSNVVFYDCKHLTATMRNVQGKTYPVSANVVSMPSETASLTQLFKLVVGK